MRLVAPRHVGSSWTGDGAWVPCIGRQICILCTARKVWFSGFVFFFVWCVRQLKAHFFGLCTSTNCWKGTISFPSLNCFCIFVKNQPSIFVLGLFLYSLFCSVNLCVYPFGNSTWYWFRTLLSGRAISSNLLFFFKIVLAILGLVYFQINFRITLSDFQDDSHCMFYLIALNMRVSFEKRHIYIPILNSNPFLS